MGSEGESHSIMALPDPVTVGGSGLRKRAGKPCRRSLGLALLAGSLMALAIAPLNFWLLAWVALVPLWAMIAGAVGDLRWQTGSTPPPHPTCHHPPIANSLLSPLVKAGILGGFWGIAYHGISLVWITGLHPLMWLGIPWLGSVAIAGGCWLLVTVWGAVLVSLWSMAMVGLGSSSRQSPWLRVLTGTALWLGLEWLWSRGPLWWTALSLTQSPGNPILLHLGQWSGPATVAAAIVAVNGCLAEAWIDHKRKHLEPTQPQPTPTRKPTHPPNPCCSLLAALSSLLSHRLVTIALLLFLLSHAIGWFTWTMARPDAPTTALRVGIVQGNIPTRIKLTPLGIRQAIQRYTAGYEQLADQGVDAVLTAEGAFPLFWEGKQRTENAFYQVVRDRGVVAWLGTFTTQQGQITQNLLTLAGNGETVGRYNKVKLVPLGEYIPFQNWLGGIINRLSPIAATMVPGHLDQQMATPFGPAIAGICYESTFAELFRRQAHHGGQFILTASNLDPYSEQLMAQHEAQDVMRAIETDRWAVRATNTGYSGVISPRGQVVRRLPPHRYQTDAVTIYRRTQQTPYVRWGDWLTPLLLLLLVAQGRIRLASDSHCHLG